MLGDDGFPKAKKNQISQEQADEIKRQQFLKILEDQQNKIKEREAKLKLKTTGIMAGVGNVGRPPTLPGKSIAASSGKSSKLRPGMEQFVNAIRLRFKGNKVQLCIPQGYRLPEVLRQKTAAELQARMKKRLRESNCSNCKKQDARKYICPRTKAVTCSFECYKAVLASAS